METDFFDWALADFSGYVAADELYDGPCCILSAVENRCDKRILYEVLDHDPNHDDIRVFLGRLKTALVARDLTLLGVTTDGSSLYPEPLAEVFPGVPHQICQFHVVKDIVKAVLRAVASERKRLAAKQPTLPRGRPSTKAAKQAARKKKRLVQKGAELFTHRDLCVQHYLSKRERKTLWSITRGLPHAVAEGPRDHGTGLRLVRSTVSDADRARQADEAEASPEPLQASGLQCAHPRAD
jgi:hypothetical protein